MIKETLSLPYIATESTVNYSKLDEFVNKTNNVSLLTHRTNASFMYYFQYGVNEKCLLTFSKELIRNVYPLQHLNGSASFPGTV